LNRDFYAAWAMAQYRTGLGSWRHRRRAESSKALEGVYLVDKSHTLLCRWSELPIMFFCHASLNCEFFPKRIQTSSNPQSVTFWQTANLGVKIAKNKQRNRLLGSVSLLYLL